MRLDSSNATHKLFVAGLLLALFALPFALQWRDVTSFDSRSMMAGGTVVANSAADDSVPSAPTTNNISQASVAAASSFTGALSQ